jgi:hypothetical protein
MCRIELADCAATASRMGCVCILYRVCDLWSRRSVVALMNLHSIVGPLVAVVNPTQFGSIRRSSGYITDTDGKQIPQYEVFNGIPMQVQSLSNDELHQLEGLNIQGNKQAIYLYDEWSGIVRVGKQGGDLLIVGGQVWLAAIVLESWTNWTKLAVTLQNGS